MMMHLLGIEPFFFGEFRQGIMGQTLPTYSLVARLCPK